MAIISIELYIGLTLSKQLICNRDWAYPEVLSASTSGHDRRRLQNASGVRSSDDGCGVDGCAGDSPRCARNDPFLGGARQSNARDCRRSPMWFCGVVPGAGTIFGKPTMNERQNANDERTSSWARKQWVSGFIHQGLGVFKWKGSTPWNKIIWVDLLIWCHTLRCDRLCEPYCNARWSSR